MKSIDIRKTVTLVVVSGGKVARKYRVNSRQDLLRQLPTKGGVPLLGPNLFVELTHKELAALGKPPGFKRLNYLSCLVRADLYFGSVPAEEVA